MDYHKELEKILGKNLIGSRYTEGGIIDFTVKEYLTETELKSIQHLMARDLEAELDALKDELSDKGIIATRKN